MTLTLKFPGKDIKCSVGLMFLGELLDETGLSLEEAGAMIQKNPFKLIPTMIHIAARVEAELDGEEFSLTRRELVEIMEKDGGIASPQVTKFVNTWTKSLTDGVPSEEPAEEGGEEPKK